MTAPKWSLLVVVLIIAGCTELPSAGDEPIFVTLTPNAPSEILVGEVGALEVEAHDEAGNRLDNPPLVWDLLEAESPGQAAVVDTSDVTDRLTLRGERTGAVVYEVRLESEGGLFQSDPTTVGTLVRYGPIQIAFVGVGPDTLLTAQGEMIIPGFSATDQNGLAPQEGHFTVDVQPGVAVEEDFILHDEGLEFWVLGQGVDTLILSHTACWDPCADTLVVTVAPVPIHLSLPEQDIRALWDTVDLTTLVWDANGYGIEGLEPVFRHVVPGDSAILRILEPVGGRVVSLRNGSVLLEVEAGGLTAETIIEVDQTFSGDWQFPPGVDYLVLGHRDTLFTEPTDSRGHPLEPDATPPHRWWEGFGFGGLQLVETLEHWGAVVEGVELGSASIDFSVEVCYRVSYDSYEPVRCRWHGQTRSFTVIPEPDSVRILPPLMDPMTELGTSDYPLRGTIFTAAENLTPTTLQWTALDPSIATVDGGGFITAVANGTARFEGRMGSSTDTVVVVVNAPGG